MPKREIQSKKRYLLAFILGTFIFLFGFIITFSVSQLQFERISNFQDETTYQIFKDKLNYDFFNEDICTGESISQISEDLGFQGNIINDLENKLGKENKNVIFRKKLYTIIELEHLEFINQLNKQCNSNIPTILFFYSNKDKDKEKSEETGRILDALHQKNPNIVIYSFDINLESELIEKLKSKYQIEKSPTIIINQNKKLTNIKNIKDIEIYLNSDSTTIWL